MVNLDSVLVLLAVPEENAGLFSLRHSKKAKRLIFKTSIRNGFEIVLPRFYDENWVLATITKNKPKMAPKQGPQIEELHNHLNMMKIKICRILNGL